ncbi:MAG: adenosine deaminase [Gemmatimonadota bacterium]
MNGLDPRLAGFIRAAPKVELHVHLEGSIRPRTLLALAKRNHVALPADTVEGLQEWYTFTDFPHFVEIYQAISRCLRTARDIERITRDFLAGQAEQNVLHTEATFTAITQYRNSGLSFDDQMDAIDRARAWASEELGVSLRLIIDIPRDLVTREEAEMVADWAIEARERGVVALGLAGDERGVPVEMFAPVFERARASGQPGIVHAGETGGAESIRAALNVLGSVRIGHGVRCLEDPQLVEELRRRQVPLEVCPSSNVRLNIFPGWAQHPLPALVEQGLYVTLNSDDPPMFNTTLTEEFLRAVGVLGFGAPDVERFIRDAARASLLRESGRAALEANVEAGLASAREGHLET